MQTGKIMLVELSGFFIPYQLQAGYTFETRICRRRLYQRIELDTDAKSMKNGMSYNCSHITEPVVIDGLLDEPVWRKAEVLDFYVPVSHSRPISKTEGRLLWDDKNLYVGYKAYDKDIFSYHTERDSQTCNDDVLEVFLKPDPDKEPYYNFEINALGTVYDALNLKRGAGGGGHIRWKMWNCEGLKIGVHIEGTINNPEDEDEFWQLEVAIPFASLPTLGGKPPGAGDTWLFHLSRYDYSIYLPEGIELTSCAPLTKVDFHHYEDWMPLKFVK